MFNIGGSEMVVLAILALLVFGPEGLPGIVKNVMRTVRALRAAAGDFQAEIKNALELENERLDIAQRRKKREPDRLEAPPQPVFGPAPPPETVFGPVPPPSTADLASDIGPGAPSDPVLTESKIEEAEPLGASKNPVEDLSTNGDPTPHVGIEDQAPSVELQQDISLDDDDDDDGPGLPMVVQRTPVES